MPCRIGVWGLFDGDAFGDVLIAHILRRELSARLPGAEIHTAAPFGSDRPMPRDGGLPAEPLGPWSPERAAALADPLDLVVVAGVELLPDHSRLADAYGVEPGGIDELDPGRWFVEGPGPEAEEQCAVIWSAVTLNREPTPEESKRLHAAASGRPPVSVADPVTRLRLASAGVGGDIEVIPDLVVLAPRLFSPDLLAKRLDYLWLMGWYPSEGAAVVVEGDATLLPIVPSLATALSGFLASEPDLKIVLAELGSRGDDQFASALAARLPSGSVYRLPRCAGLEDVATAIANCAIFAGSSRRAGLVALAFGRAQLTLDLAFPPTVDDFEQARQTDLAPATEPSPTAQADAELDRIAEIATAATLTRTRKEIPMPDIKRLSDVEESLGHLQVAHEARSRRLATERMVFANHLHKAEAEIARLKDESARLREELARADGQTMEADARTHAEVATRQALEAELSGLRATRTFRYTAELRSVYGRLRRMGENPAPETAPENEAKLSP